MEVIIGLVFALIGVVAFIGITVAVLGLIALADRRWGGPAAGSHDSGVPVDEASWREIVKQLGKGSTSDEPGDGSLTGGTR